jgi:uncharacterized LabA/DUF88 family protein
VKRRANFYIDGFNLYYGLKAAGLRQHLWLDLVALCRGLTKSNSEEFRLVKYFTAVTPNPPHRRKRHLLYLDALRTTLPNIQIFEGKYYDTKESCPFCRKDYIVPREKHTDVNIGCQLLRDATLNEFDVAYLISGDSDLVPAIRTMKELAPGKKIGVWFPPERRSFDLQKEAQFAKRIPDALIVNCQFPDPIKTPAGALLPKPEKWK